MVGQIISDRYKKMKQVQYQGMEELFSKKNVVGVAIGHKIIGGRDTGEPAIMVMVEKKMPSELLRTENIIPQKMDEFKTDVVEVGKILANRKPGNPYITFRTTKTYSDSNRSYYRFFEEADRSALKMEEVRFKPKSYNTHPATDPDYLHLLHQRVRLTTNAFNTISVDFEDDQMLTDASHSSLILDNYHLFQKPTGYQTGTYNDMYSPRDESGSVRNFVPIRFKTQSYTPINYVDAAIADLSSYNVSDTNKRDSYYHIRNRHNNAGLFSIGEITAINATIDVTYENGRVARFSKQIVTTRIGESAGYGGLVTDFRKRVVGLPFAHSSYITVINDLQYIQALLKVRIHQK